ncbi:carboxylesterase/lipase family protein [Neobacillus sp. 179-C4.2 HS]|uniref:Carboxylic ester hydrolase n=1 Tax=Neobacillus driksii TaxID=3035913 RepID=A0ABV4YVF6_9BACI|nr:carboxylesterase/lipase family protein [Neobacillus sp. 179.-C4.2 HS]MDP5194049.1 carboxylesterase/lipase family protein [Neobacillus sp. 179.-C4.2 HS]
MTNTIVESVYGKLQGEQINGVFTWKGIPYAKPPVGSLRFRAPERPESWEGIRDVCSFGPVAPQSQREIMEFFGNDISNMSEDCLYLNVWSKGADDKKRPVMVWIHGGAFVSGSGSSSWYDGASFAAQGDVVVVTINYRLGIFGFLHLGEIGGEEYATSGNCGIQDQVAALQWVQENIAAFGGDPNNVTIFGESAGAMSIGVLLGFPSAQGLFHKAILQSGAAANVHSSEKATKIAGHLLATLQVEPTNLSKLEELSVEQLIQAADLVPPMSLGPVIDGVSLPRHPEEAIADGSAKDITILIGTNKDEYNIFSVFDPEWKNADETKVTQLFEKTFGPLVPLISSYHEGNQPLSQELYNKLLTMSVFTYPAQRLTELQVKQGAPVWMYRFDWETPVFGGALKSTHALEIPFVFNTLDTPNTENFTGSSPEREFVASQMHQAWINFARNGNPNSEGLPEWPQYNLNDRSTLIFNIESVVENDPNRKERMIWEQATMMMKS